MISNRIKKLDTFLRDFSEKHRHTSLHPRTLKPRYIVGIVLIITSFLVGWGIPIAAVIYAVSKRRVLIPAAVGIVSYAASWGIFSAGIVLSTKQSLVYVQALCAKIIHAFIDPLERITVLQVIGFLFIACAAVFFVTGFSVVWAYIVLGTVVLHQIVLICSLVIQNNALMNRPIRGKTLQFVYPATINSVVFRFDDGPHPVVTPIILDTLKAANVRAFFCITGELAKQYPQIVQRTFNEGHNLVNHTKTHPKLFSLLMLNRLKTEIVETQKIIYDITGEYPRFFASPMGHENIFLKQILRQNNLLLFGWDINARDAFGITSRGSEKVFKKIQKNNNPAILIFHDGSYASDDNRHGTLALVQAVIRDIC